MYYLFSIINDYHDDYHDDNDDDSDDHDDNDNDNDVMLLLIFHNLVLYYFY
jgi:hypothetical protein